MANENAVKTQAARKGTPTRASAETLQDSPESQAKKLGDLKRNMTALEILSEELPTEILSVVQAVAEFRADVESRMKALEAALGAIPKYVGSMRDSFQADVDAALEGAAQIWDIGEPARGLVLMKARAEGRPVGEVLTEHLVNTLTGNPGDGFLRVPEEIVKSFKGISHAHYETSERWREIVLATLRTYS